MVPAGWPTTAFPAPTAPAPWSAATLKFWQYTDSPIDGDRFLGTEAELLTFTKMPASR